MTDSTGFEDPAQDDAYRSLFRPTEEPAAPVADPETPGPRSVSTASTGRLFRSRGAEVGSDTLVAISADEAARLHSMTAIAQPEVGTAPDAMQPTAAPAVPAPIAAFPVAAASDEVPEEESAMAVRQRQEPGLAPAAVYILVIGVTLIAGVIDAYFSGPGLGWITGIALLVSSIYCAIRVRASELSVSVIAPPLAFGIAAITVGQIGQSRAGGTMLAWINNSFFTLADNWFWVISTTLICLAIAVVRSRR